jgi:hypothetical protein
MAGNQNSGGMRPTAPQNNPANVNALGGNGQSGTQSLMPMTGLTWGTNQATEDIGRAAPLAGNPTAMNAAEPTQATQTPLSGLGGPTEFPDQHVSHGNDMQGLAMPAMATPQPEKAMQIVSALYAVDPTNEDLRFILEGASDQGRI